MSREVMIVAGEASGDLHGSRLVRSMLKRDADLSFCGVGGAELRQAGVEILFEASRIAVVGFFEVISHLSDIVGAQRVLRRRLERSRPNLLILIDFPDFNLLLARKAKRLGIPIFYYISPQVWAWRATRVRTIAKLVDIIGVILPFEEQFYRDRGVDARYVGHPLLDSVRAERTREQFCHEIGVDHARELVGILPGSRIKEIGRLLPVFLEAAKRLQDRSGSRPVFLIPLASTLNEADVRTHGVERFESVLDIAIVPAKRYDLMAACDAVIAASGTVTLELLLLGTPMVVAYKLSPHTYRLGKLLVTIKYFSLVNLIADEDIVPELLQDEANPERISEIVDALLHEPRCRQRMLAGFARVKQKLGSPGASDRAADLALSLLQ